MEKTKRDTPIDKDVLKHPDNDNNTGDDGNDLLSLIALIIAEYILNEGEE